MPMNGSLVNTAGAAFIPTINLHGILIGSHQLVLYFVGVLCDQIVWQKQQDKHGPKILWNVDFENRKHSRELLINV